MLDVSKEAVPVGTVAGFQLLLLLKMLSAGTASQVAFCARATPGSSAATATNVVVASSAAIRPFRRSRTSNAAPGPSTAASDPLASDPSRLIPPRGQPEVRFDRLRRASGATPVRGITKRVWRMRNTRGHFPVRWLHPSRRGQEAAPQDEECVPRMLRSAKRCAADPGSIVHSASPWVPALRCIVKYAAPRPGHETHCFTLSQDEVT